MDVNVYHHFEEATLHRVVKLLDQLIVRINDMSKELDDLTAAVTAENTVIDSAITLLNNLSAAILAANAISPAAVEAVATEVAAKSAALSAAVTANTPAA